jgi:oligopeptide/dipeptide ABC transporter ATP-binding protein
MLLRVTGLTTEFPIDCGGRHRWVPAVDDVSFAVGPGETLGLVGESGCGKSVAALSILGLVPPPGRIARGSIEFDGLELTRCRPAEWQRVRGARIGFVFQEPMSALNPAFTIGDQIAETLLAHGRASTRSDARRRTIELLDAVRLPDPDRRVRDYPFQLSGGMRQRALLAAAIACQPALLIADEPTTALDVTIQAEILDLLREMRRTFGLAMLLITHDLTVVSRLADRVAVMYAGRIVEEGPTALLLRSPLHPYTDGLLASLPGPERGSRLDAIPGSVPDIGSRPPGCAFAPRCPARLDRCDAGTPALTFEPPGRAVRCVLHAGGD